MTPGGLSGGGERLRAVTRLSRAELCPFTELTSPTSEPRARTAAFTRRIPSRMHVLFSPTFLSQATLWHQALRPSVFSRQAQSRTAQEHLRALFHHRHRHQKLLSVAMGSPGSKKHKGDVLWEEVSLLHTLLKAYQTNITISLPSRKRA